MDPTRPDDAQEDLLLHLTFVPSWARRPPTEYGSTEAASTADENALPAGTDEPETERRHGERRPPPRQRRDYRRGHERSTGAPPRQSEPRPRDAGRSPRSTRERRDEARPQLRPPLPLSIAFLPERHSLSVVAHRIQASHRAYPLLQLAEFFLSRPEFHLVRIEVAPSAPSPNDPDRPAEVTLFQCAECGVVYSTAGAAQAHVVESHAEVWFETRELSEEPPPGQFTCVARCPFTGRLIGPPNHHSFASAVTEAAAGAGRERKMTVAEYQLQLEMVRDPAAIEQWRHEYAHRRAYFRRDQSPAEPLSWAEARRTLELELAPTRVKSVSRAIIPGRIAEQINDPGIRASLRAAWHKEQRFPHTMMDALRPALRHMRLHFFKTDGHHTYVTAIRPCPLAPDHAVAPIREALTYLAAHPGIHREAVAADVLRERAHDSAARTELFGHIAWLVERGHVIEYFDGSLAVPAVHRGGHGPAEPTSPSPAQ
ncbi:MAG: hypothetical protein N2652_08455 [Kiritimatiellae bacterium]|nr:hypothetical protein [Kiritimatiellia bacterium]